MKICYVDKNFGPEALKVIDQANTIIKEYTDKGYDLTLRQLYYQFVSRGLFGGENNDKLYKKLGCIVSDGRLAGLISWKAIVDRTRNLQGNPHWEDPKQFMLSVAPQFQMDKWADQEYRVEVWVEKDALLGVVERACRKLDVSYFSCRGYTSQSEIWSAARRLKDYAVDEGQQPVIIHLGDHDPSGKDMSRDIFDRIELFCTGDAEVEVNRIALTMAQVEKYNPPPNPAKITDTRAKKYIKEFGHESWELDALDPVTLTALIEKTVVKYRDDDKWDDAIALEARHRKTLIKTAEKQL